MMTDAHEQELGAGAATVLLRPVWQTTTERHEQAGPLIAQRLVIVCEPPADWRAMIEADAPGTHCINLYCPHKRIDQRYESYATRVFSEIQRLLKVKPAGAVLVQLLSLNRDALQFAPGLIGLLKTARLEDPQLLGQLIELEQWPDRQRLIEVLRENSTGEEHVSYQQGRRLVRRWQEQPAQSQPAPHCWKDQGVYLISGAGGLGWLFGHAIIAQVNHARIILAGRTPLDAAKQARIDTIAALGATVEYRQLDVAELEQATALIADIMAQYGRLDGILHTAGVIHDDFIIKKSHQTFQQVLAPKVAGLVNLDYASRRLPLDFFVLFSSTAGAMGNTGQADYAAANGFMDYYAGYRNRLVAKKQRHGRMIAINWPLWQAGGMSIDQEAQQRTHEQRGLVPLATNDGLQAFYQCMASAEDQLLVLAGDRRMINAYMQAPLPSVARAEPSTRVPQTMLLAGTLQRLKALFGAVIKLESARIDGEAALESYGIDSLVITRLNQQLALVFDDLPKTLFYQYPTLAALAAYFVDQHPQACIRWVQDAVRPGEATATQPHDSADRHAARRTGAASRQGTPDGARREPIAIIGISGRYPQAATLDAFWQNLLAGRDCISEIPAERWPLAGFYTDDMLAAVQQGQSYSKWGGFVAGFADFDPLFFNISPREAIQIDPQERLFIEACWEVLEDAGYTRAALLSRHGGRVGVFAGVTKTGFDRYGPQLRRQGALVFPQTSFSSLANRVSYLMDFRGPSMPIDTMCSSSLTAIHEACEHLYQNACELAIAGGVNLYLHPSSYVELCQRQMLAQDGRCRSFGSGGSGFVPGEGVGCVLLKPLARAQADGDQIYAVIRATSINHGGKTNGYTVPNPSAHAALIRAALDQAGVHPRTISYIEAHGTGTALGDPVEIAGLTEVFREQTADRQFCAIGSVKSNIGHLEAAAGMAGVTKVILQLRHAQLVPSLHADELNPNIDFANTPFVVQREAAQWQPPSVTIAGETRTYPRIAGVSAFGAGGANAHVILEEYVLDSAPPAAEPAQPLLIPLSARNVAALHEYAQKLLAFIERPGIDLAALAYTLQTGREAMEERLCLLVATRAQLAERLRAFIAGEPITGVYRGRVKANHEALAALDADPKLQQLISSWIGRGALEQLAALWVKGLPLDWEQLYSNPPRRISLPTYPFTRKRYWPVTPSDPRRDAKEREEVPYLGVPSRDFADRTVRQVIIAHVADVVQLAPDEIDPQRPFADYGLDSILGVSLIAALNRTLGTTLETTTLFDYSSVERLQQHIVADYPATLQLPQNGVHADNGSAAQRSEVLYGDEPAAHAHDAKAPIAIIGMSARFAKSPNVQALWAHLANGDDLIEEVSRWHPAGAASSLPPAGAGAGCRHGSFIDDIDCFDPLFFNISGLEASTMDPQQRLFLEEAWHALEDAGYAGAGLKGWNCGVYVGCWAGDYQALLGDDAPGQALWGNMASVIASRISYYLDLHGPAIAVDTSCSSSLVSLHLACQDLRRGEIALGLAGGVFVQSTPRLYHAGNRAGMLSPSGHCHSFDERADGFVPGEGVGVVVLKRLADALRDGDHIYGVVRGSGMNQDGTTNGITAPSALSQERLLRQIYDSYGVDAGDIQLVEAHGTGTPLGDPIEFRALVNAFRTDTNKRAYCALGSIKTNLGHTQFAAGIAGVLKVLLALQHQQIPPSLHYRQSNPAIALADSPFYINTELRDWLPGANRVRCGVVSSFGASGTNAHVVIEEAPALPPHVSRRPEYLLVLSAASRFQLQQLAGELLNHCRRQSVEIGPLCFTLAGRRHLNVRLAAVVRDRAELVEWLAQWLAETPLRVAELLDATRPDQAALQSQAEAPLHRLSAANDSTGYLAALSELAALYLQGYEPSAGIFDPADQRRVSLPTYPFKRERFWVDNTAANRQGLDSAGAGLGVRLLLEDVSTLAGRRFRITFDGDEFFLADHHVQGRQLLPAVISLELARTALTQAALAESPPPEGELRLENLVWLSPVVYAGQPLTLFVQLRPQGERQIGFEICAASGAVHTQGVARWEANAAVVVDLAALRQACDHYRLPARLCYKAIAAMGIRHGPALQALDELYVGDGEVLARLRLPDVAGSAAGYQWHPSMLDAAIQASIGLRLGPDGALLEQRSGMLISEDSPRSANGKHASASELPFALESLQYWHPCGREMWAYLREQRASVAQPKLDIDLIDDAGRVCVRMRGYAARVLAAASTAAAASPGDGAAECMLLQPVWEPATPQFAAPAPASSARVLIVGATLEQQAALRQHYPQAQMLEQAAADSVLAETLRRQGRPFEQIFWIAPQDGADPVQDQEQGVIALFRLIKAVLELEYDAGELWWTLLTSQTQAVHPSDPLHPNHAGLHGLIGSLAKEYPQWRLRLLDVAADAPWPQICRLPADPQGQPWAYRSGEWFRQQLIPVQMPPPTTSAYRWGGVYVVIGGAGGIGVAWSNYMIRRYRARIVWIGRRPLDAAIQRQIDTLAQLGPAPLYISADAADESALRLACQEIRQRYGQIHGLIHAAIVLLDQSLARMTEARFRAGLAAKVDVGVRMAQVFGDEALDFVLFFSSIQAFFKAPGQSNYAAGCTFKDAFAQQLARCWRCPVKIINWGYWGSVGVVAAEPYRERMAQAGLASIEPAEGMAALETLLAGPLAQLALVNLADTQTLSGFNDQATCRVYADGLQADAVASMQPRLHALAVVREQAIARLRAQVGAQANEMDPWLIPLLWAQLQSLGLFRDRASASADELRSQAGIKPGYGRWLEQTLSVLTGAGYLREEQQRYAAVDPVVRDPALLWDEWRARKADWLRDESRVAQVLLVETTLQALPEILTGSRLATAVIFPDASLRLVEGVYQNNPVADYFNAVLADTLVLYLEQRLHHDPATRIRILEIGAGAGGTSSMVFQKLQGYRDQVESYCYTDISKAFLLHAQKQYQHVPYLEYQLFHVEKPLAEQNIAAGSYDVVIATNVLHATRNIRNSVRNVKAALKNHGMLLLNEISDNVLFSHLTFGLLDGWWLYDDPAVRIPGSPGLFPESWRRLLVAEGFEHIGVLVPQAHALGQQIIMAASNGVVRQARAMPTTNPMTPTPTPLATRSQQTEERAAVVQAVADDVLRERSRAYFKQLVAETLRISCDEIESAVALERYGIDSILVVQLTNALRKVISPVSSTLLFEVQTIDALVAHFIENRKEALIRLVGLETVEATAPRTPATAAPSLLLAGERAGAEGPLDIAIIGLAGRYPGADSLAAFWENLRAGKDCISEIPAERWPHERYFDPERGVAGKTYSKWGGFLKDIDAFDPLFFNISPHEAALLDPQERLFLECAYEALEDGGYTSATLGQAAQGRSGSVGVFVGVMYSEYQLWGVQETLAGRPTVVSSSISAIANRVSYFLNLHGPSMAVDTMCAAALTAIHLACTAIVRGECAAAIAGGVNLSLHPNKYLMIGQSQFAASDGRCRSFGRDGDGYVPGEGVGAVLLKPLAQAISDGDQIYGVIKGSAVNHGGRTNGFTVPNPLAQSDVIDRALRQAGIDARAVSYIEAHGTGTALGDPIEISGLTKSFRAYTQATGFCAIGSAKSNIGHCESAAGIAGLTKVLLQMQHGQLVPSLHAEELNPRIDFDDTPFVVQQTLAEWRRPQLDHAGETREYPRIAGVSAFGAGGANAHILIEEYRAPAAPPLAITPTRPALIVLSAQTEAQLQAVAARLLQALETAAFTEVDLAAMAYTLQVGRAALEHRLALTASSLVELRQQLRRWLAGETPISGLYRGQVKQGKQMLALFADDQELQEALAKWLDRGKWSKLLELWVIGLMIDWNRLYPDIRPRRISLPTYPFARERYWIPQTVEQHLRRDGRSAESAWLHPLLHRNTSDLTELRFSSCFSGEELLLAHHRIGGARVFPGAGYLELARAAAVLLAGIAEEQQWGLRLQELAWSQSLLPDAPLTLHIAFEPGADGDLRYEIYDDAGAEPLIHGRGRVCFSGVAAAPPQHIAALSAACDQQMAGSAYYQMLAALGFDYGAAHQSITTLAYSAGAGRRVLLARLQLPDCLALDSAAYVLHPSLVNGALQAALAWQVLAAPPLLLAEEGAGAEGQRAGQAGTELPFSLTQLDLLAPCPLNPWVAIREAAGVSQAALRLDIDLLDEAGRVCVRMHGFSGPRLQGMTDALRTPSVAAPELPSGNLVLRPLWQLVADDQRLPQPQQPGRLAVVGGSASDQRDVLACAPAAQLLTFDSSADVATMAQRLQECGPLDHILWLAPAPALPTDFSAEAADALIEAQHQSALSCFRLIKALLRAGYGERSLGFTAVTRQTQAIAGDEPVYPAHGGIPGLVGTLAKEYPCWQVRPVDLAVDTPLPLAEILALPADQRGHLWVQRQRWYRHQLLPVLESSQPSSGFRIGGVYVVIGGAGSIGQAFSEYLIRRYQAQLIWIGRRPLDSTIQANIDRLAALGPAPAYLSADASDGAALQRAYTEITQPQVHGLIHSAMVFSSDNLADLTENAFSAALTAKVNSSVRMAQVFGRQPLDFVLFFSSLVSFIKNPQQAHYAAGCGFTDAFARHLAQAWRCPVKVMHWGYWGNRDMQPAHIEQINALGLELIDPQAGMQALESLLAGPFDQLAVMKTSRPIPVEGMSTTEALTVYPAGPRPNTFQITPFSLTPQPPLPEWRGGAERSLVRNSPLPRTGGCPLGADGGEGNDGALQAMLAQILLAQLRASGLLDPATDSEQQTAIGLLPRYRRWLEESRRMLLELGYLAQPDRPELPELWTQWQTQRPAWIRDRDISAQVILAEATLQALPEILTGRRMATEVLFPNASIERVAGIYTNNRVADYFNAALADALLAYLRERCQIDATPIRILEIGAGTGGTTTLVLQRLQPHQDQIREYCYTDLSKAFLMHARAYGDTPFLSYRIFDVSAPPASQGIDVGGFDIVIAANVLHATKNIRQTLANTKALLKSRGLLLLNEISRASLFNHITFGLLDGWWLYDDPELRIPGCPALAADTWRQVLAEAGFERIRFPTAAARELGQQIIVAESDGVIRQPLKCET